jgi:hypothetical protein
MQFEKKKSFRSQSNDGNNKKGKKRTHNLNSSTSTNHKVTVPTTNARNTQSNHKTNKNYTKSNNNGGGSVSIGSSVHGPCTNEVIYTTTITTTTTTATTTPSQSSTVVKLSPAPSTGSARTSSPIVNVTQLKKYRDEPSTSRTPESYISAVTATNTNVGGLKFGYEPQNQLQQSTQQHSANLILNTNSSSVLHSVKESPPSSPGSEASARKRRKGTSSNTPQSSPHGFNADSKKEKDDKESKTSTLNIQNGAIAAPITHHHMLGNTINPSSNVAKNMTETLNMEIEAHSIYTNDPQPNLIGPQYPGRKDSVRKFSK